MVRLSNQIGGNYTFAGRQKFSSNMLIAAILIGLVFIAIGGFQLFGMLSSGDNPTTTGYSVDIAVSNRESNLTYTPIISYEVNGFEYRIKRSTYTAWKPPLGEEHTISYNPENPADAKIIATGLSADVVFHIIFILLGLSVIVGAFYMFITSLKRTTAIDSLLTRGQRLDGVLVDVRSRMFSRDNRKGVTEKLYQLVVIANDHSGQPKEFYSDEFTPLPTGLMFSDIQSAAIPIDVYIDPIDSSKYYVDLADIPTITPEKIQELIAQSKSDQSIYTD